MRNIKRATWVNRGYAVALDKECYEYPWPRQKFEKLELRYAYVGNSLAGFVAYDLITSQIREIKRIGVKTQFRRMGVGTDLLQYLCDESHDDNNPYLTAFVDERNLGALQFFKSFGFKSRLVRNKYDDVDSIHFRYQVH